jgi:hypothetical protein
MTSFPFESKSEIVRQNFAYIRSKFRIKIAINIPNAKILERIVNNIFFGEF